MYKKKISINFYYTSTLHQFWGHLQRALFFLFSIFVVFNVIIIDSRERENVASSADMQAIIHVLSV